MANLEKLKIEKLKMLAKARGIDGHQNIYRQQLGRTLTTPSTCKPALKLV